MDTIKDPQFGDILDYDRLRAGMMDVLDNVYPTFNLMGSMLQASKHFRNNPSYMTACAASGLAYMMLVAAEEYELAAQLKGKIFTLSWTEEHTGTDLLSVRTRATPESDDEGEKRFHIQGQKWLINNSYHADYHSVIAKVDPEADGPRSLSLFAVPHSSTKNWQRLETHVLRSMVLTKFDIDGPGILIGQVGRGLEILQRMALPSKYHCAYMGVKMVDDSLPAAIEHLSSKQHLRRQSDPLQQCLSASFTIWRWRRRTSTSPSSAPWHSATAPSCNSTASCSSLGCCSNATTSCRRICWSPAPRVSSRNPISAATPSIPSSIPSLTGITR